MGEKDNKIRILFISAFYSPIPGGSSVIMKNLIDSLPEKQVVGLITQDIPVLEDVQNTENNAPVYKIYKELNYLQGRFSNYLRKIFFRRNLKKVLKIIQITNPTHIVGTYPSPEFLYLGYQASKRVGIPFYPYLHDTIEEALSHTAYAKFGRFLEKCIFKSCTNIFVMSDGMKKLYLKKHKTLTIPLRHSFPENKKLIINHEYDKNIFWGGAIYKINTNAVKRVSEACSQLEINFTVATNQSFLNLKRIGISGDHIKTVYYNRQDYITNIRKQGILLIALDFPDESEVHPNELSTIFSTKIVEYLFTGRPILVHAPAEYFVSVFCKENKCGHVVSEKSLNTLKDAINRLLEDTKYANQLIENGYKVTELFKLENINKTFFKILKQES